MERELAAYFNTLFFTLATLIPIVNPLGTAPVFLSLTADLPVDARHRLAAAVGRHAFILLASAMLVGSHVLGFFGVSLPIVRIGGGLLVTANGWKLLHAEDARGDADAEQPKAIDTWEREVARRAFYPLTFPLTVGPGSVSVAITLGARIQSAGEWSTVQLAANLIAIAIIAGVVFLSYRFASTLIDTLGETGTIVFLRLSSFILLCIGVSIVWSGLVDLITPLLDTRPAAP